MEQVQDPAASVKGLNTPFTPPWFESMNVKFPSAQNVITLRESIEPSSLKFVVRYVPKNSWHVMIFQSAQALEILKALSSRRRTAILSSLP